MTVEMIVLSQKNPFWAYWKCIECGMIDNANFVCYHNKRLKNKAYSWKGAEWHGGT